VAIDDRLDRIEGEFGAELCAGRYCRRIYHTELIILPDGREVVTGEQPLPLCDTCPEHQKDEPRIRHIEVKRDYRRHTGAGAAEDATRRAVAPSAELRPLTTICRYPRLGSTPSRPSRLPRGGRPEAEVAETAERSRRAGGG
jgi:hypothetical protein